MKRPSITLALVLYFQILLAVKPDVTIVPFICKNNLALIQAEVEGKKGYFILDTGTPDLTLNRSFFKGEASEKVFYGVNSKALDVELKFVRLNINGFIKDSEARIIDYTAIVANTGLPVLGAIGNRAFDGCEIVFDYIFKEITIYRLGRTGDPLQNRALHEPPRDTLAFVQKGSMPTIAVLVGETTVRIGLDSGAGVNVWDENKKNGIAPCSKKLETRVLVSFGADTILARGVELDSVRVRSIGCPALNVYFISMKQLNRDLPGPELDGILGYEFLSRYRTAINFRKKEIYIWNAAYVQEQLAAVQSGEKKREE